MFALSISLCVFKVVEVILIVIQTALVTRFRAYQIVPVNQIVQMVVMDVKIIYARRRNPF